VIQLGDSRRAQVASSQSTRQRGVLLFALTHARAESMPLAYRQIGTCTNRDRSSKTSDRLLVSFRVFVFYDAVGTDASKEENPCNVGCGH
jgi:hypothetical protein